MLFLVLLQLRIMFYGEINDAPKMVPIALVERKVRRSHNIIVKVDDGESL